MIMQCFNKYGVTCWANRASTECSKHFSYITNQSFSSLQGFIQDLFLRKGEGDVDVCMHMLVHQLDFKEILDIFKDMKHQIQL